jgi:hypothetical protein
MSERIRKFCTVCLLVLIVSPFTAPFSTCDLAYLLYAGTGETASVLVQPSVDGTCKDDVYAPGIFVVVEPVASHVGPNTVRSYRVAALQPLAFALRL